MDDPEFVDAFQGFTVADEQWALRQFRNGDGPHEDIVDDSWTPRNLADLDDVPPVQPTLGGLGLVYPGKRHVFSGPQESAKTLAAYVVGLQVVREGQKVVLIDFEMGPWDAKQRLRELGATGDELGGFLYVEPDTRAGEENVGRLVGLEPALVIVDAAVGAFQLESLNDNDRKEVEQWASKWVTPFWRAGIATLVIDHVTKNVEQRGNYAIGSERKVGGADVHLGFTVTEAVKRGGAGKYRVTTHKDRGGFLRRGKLAEFHLRSDPETHSIRWAFDLSGDEDPEAEFRPTTLMEKVSHYLERQSDPVSLSDVKDVVTGKGEFITVAVNILVKEEYVEETKGAHGARLLTLNTAYRESADPAVPDLFPAVPENVDSSCSPFPVPRQERDGDEIGDGNSIPVPGNEDDGIPF